MSFILPTLLLLSRCMAAAFFPHWNMSCLTEFESQVFPPHTELWFNELHTAWQCHVRCTYEYTVNVNNRSGIVQHCVYAQGLSLIDVKIMDSFGLRFAKTVKFLLPSFCNSIHHQSWFFKITGFCTFCTLRMRKFVTVSYLLLVHANDCAAVDDK